MSTALPPSASRTSPAAARIEPHAHHTPVITSANMDSLTGATLFFKCENLQRVGAFKFRGARMPCSPWTTRPRSAAWQRTLPATMRRHWPWRRRLRASMPASSCRRMPLGSKWTQCAAMAHASCFRAMRPKDRERSLEEVVKETGAEFVHPSDDLRVIAGQAPAHWRSWERSRLDIIITPGWRRASQRHGPRRARISPKTRVIGAEPAAADDAFSPLRPARSSLR